MLFSSSDVIRHFPMRDFNGYLLSGSTSLCSWSWPWASSWHCWWRAAWFKGQSPRGLLWLRSLSKSCAKCRSRASPPHLCILLLFQTFVAWTPQGAYLYLGLKNKRVLSLAGLSPTLCRACAAFHRCCAVPFRANIPLHELFPVLTPFHVACFAVILWDDTCQKFLEVLKWN